MSQLALRLQCSCVAGSEPAQGKACYPLCLGNIVAALDQVLPAAIKCFAYRRVFGTLDFRAESVFVKSSASIICHREQQSELTLLAI